MEAQLPTKVVSWGASPIGLLVQLQIQKSRFRNEPAFLLPEKARLTCLFWDAR
jgi:hypothetical protein